MASITALVLVILLYIIPLNLRIYVTSEQTVNSILQSKQGILLSLRELPIVSYILENMYTTAVAFFYVLNVAAIFLIIYLLFRFILVRSIYVFMDREVDIAEMLRKYSQGQRHINAISNLFISLLLITHIIFKAFDIKIFVLGVLCIMYVYRDGKEKAKAKERKEKDTKTVEEELVKSSENTLNLQWVYNLDPLSVDYPVRFFARVPYSKERYEEFQQKQHQDNSSSLLKNYVLEGLCPEIIELANQINAACKARSFTTFHTASAVMALQQSFKYVYDIDSKGFEEYIRYPLETLVDKEGDCDCHSTCSAAILYSMGYEVVLLRIMFPDGDGHLALAVEGADGLPGNFFELSGKWYYYCEVTPSDNNTMKFRVGEMPEMPGANITVVSVKEIVKMNDF